MNPFESLWCDEVPEEVLRLIERFEQSADEARQSVQRQAAQIRSRAEAKIDGLQQKADEEIRAEAEALARKVRPMLEGYLKAGKLGEVLAVRERLRGLRTGMTEVLPDPGMLHIAAEDFGKTFYYEVTATGHPDYPGGVYGTDVYTGDASLAGSCVHAGVLKPGEKGVVKVTVLDKPHPSFQGSSRNGVTSFPWQGAYPAYRVSRA